MSLVSIVITTFNRVKFLEEAVQSALRQTFGDFELLICDDGCLEETRELCESFRDPRIRHIQNSSRLGIAMNTYAGIMGAKSDLIAFLNDDDRWTPEFLEKCALPLIADNRAVLAFSDHWLMNADGDRLVERTEEATRIYCRNKLSSGYVNDRLALIVHNSIPLAMASVFRKSAVDWSLYSAKVEGAYDYFLSYCLLRSGGEVIYIPERLTEWRTHEESATAKFGMTNCVGSAYVNELIFHDPSFTAIATETRRKCIGGERHLAKLFGRQRRIIPTLAHLIKALRYWTEPARER